MCSVQQYNRDSLSDKHLTLDGYQRVEKSSFIHCGEVDARCFSFLAQASGFFALRYKLSI